MANISKNRQYEQLSPHEDFGRGVPPLLRMPMPDIRAPLEDTPFHQWYAWHAGRLGLDKNPYHPEHYYDYEAAYEAGEGPDDSGHWPSRFKLEGHPRTVLDGIDTRTMEPVPGFDAVLYEALKEFTPAIKPSGTP